MHKINLFTLNKGFRFRPQSIFLILFLVFFLSACGSISTVNYLRDAQEMFNQTAMSENQLKKSLDEPGLTTSKRENILSASGVHAGYASVIHSLNSFDTEQTNQLKQDKLWGNVLMLKSLAYYRLGEIDNLNTVVTEAKVLDATEIFPRDKAMISAIPGLVRINQAYRVIQLPTPSDNNEKNNRLVEVESLLHKGIEILDETRQKNATHPIRFFLIESQLAGYKNLVAAYVKFVNPVAVPQEQDTNNAECNLWRLTQGLIKDELKKAQANVSFWQNILGVKALGAKCSSQ